MFYFLPINREKRMEIFCRFVKGMDDNMRNMLQIGHDSRKKHTGRKYKYMYRYICWTVLGVVCANICTKDDNLAF